MLARQAVTAGAAQPFAEVVHQLVVADHEDDAAGRVRAAPSWLPEPEPTTISPTSVTAWALPWI
jgi:hypothetical protein